jgi:type IV secretory pathway TrbD component
MRKTVRLHAALGPEERLAGAIRDLHPTAQRALVQIADREDLPLVAGTWEDAGGGCLVRNVAHALGETRAHDPQTRTVDLRVLDLLPEMSSRDLNMLIVAWDEAAAQEGRTGDPALRRLLRGALVRAGVPPTLEAFDRAGLDVPAG